jgi:hypothetical protein
MLEHYKYFVRGALSIGYSCYGQTLYVVDIFTEDYRISAEHYRFLKKAGDTKLVRTLLC